MKRQIPATAERTFDAFLDPDMASKFMFATEAGKMVYTVIDPKVGGEFVFVDRRPDGDAEHYGTYQDIVRPKRIVFTFTVEKNSDETDLVSIEILPEPKGCEVVLTHELLAEFSEYKDKVAEGWTGILQGLETTLFYSVN